MPRTWNHIGPRTMIQLWRHGCKSPHRGICGKHMLLGPWCWSHEPSGESWQSGLKGPFIQDGLLCNALPCPATTKVKMNKEGIKSKHWRWSLTMGKDGNCCVTFSTYWRSTPYNQLCVALVWNLAKTRQSRKDRTQITQNTLFQKSMT